MTPPRSATTSPTTPEQDQPEAPGPILPGPSFSQALADGQRRQLPGPAAPDQAPPVTAASDLSAPSRPIPTDQLKGIIRAKGKAYAKIAQGLMHALGGIINMTIAVDEDDAAFLPDEDDDATIPPPLGRLAARKMPLFGDGEDFSDLEDIGMAVVGLLAWAAKGVTEHLTARRERGPKGKRAQVPTFDGRDVEDQDQGPGA